MRIAIGKEVSQLCKKCRYYYVTKFENGQEIKKCLQLHKEIISQAISCDWFQSKAVTGDILDSYLLHEAIEGGMQPIIIDPKKQEHTAGFL